MDNLLKGKSKCSLYMDYMQGPSARRGFEHSPVWKRWWAACWLSPTLTHSLAPLCRTQPAHPYVAAMFMYIFPASSQWLCKDMVLSHKQRNRDSKSINVWAKFKSVSDTCMLWLPHPTSFYHTPKTVSATEIAANSILLVACRTLTKAATLCREL